MKKLIVSLFLALMVGVGLGLELPDESTVVVTDGSGAIVEFGEFEDGSLELSISQDASGFLLLTFTTEDGDVMTVEAMVSEEGTLVVTDGLTDLAAEAGDETEISFVSSEEIAAEVEDGLDVADDAAGENGAEGREVAREARDTRGQPDVSELPVDDEEGS